MVQNQLGQGILKIKSTKDQRESITLRKECRAFKLYPTKKNYSG